MKKIAIAVAAFAALSLTLHAGVVSSFADIQNWAGDGSGAANKAGMVIQWNVGTNHYSRAWGYGWNSGTRTGWDMITAIDVADVQLTIVPNAGSVFGVFFDLDADGGNFSPGTPGVYGVTSDAAGSTTDADDVYQSGWVSAGFWEYSVYGGSFSYDVYDMSPPYDYLGSFTYNSAGSYNYSAVTWFSSPIGSGARELIDGAWDAYSFAPFFAPESVLQPLAAAVPEPSPALLVFLSIGLLYYARRRLYAC